MLCLDYDFFLCACDSGEFLCEFEFEVIILVFFTPEGGYCKQKQCLICPLKQKLRLQVVQRHTAGLFLTLRTMWQCDC